MRADRLTEILMAILRTPPGAFVRGGGVLLSKLHEQGGSKGTKGQGHLSEAAPVE